MAAIFTVRPACGADHAGVTRMLQRSYPELMRAHYDADLLAAAIPIITTAQPALLESGAYFVAETDDGTIIGSGGWTHEKPGTQDVEPGVAHIRHFGVDPGWTRRGVGRRIYERCAADATRQDVREFACYSSRNGEAFYASLGFRTVGPIDVPMPQDILFPSILMTADLNHGAGS